VQILVSINFAKNDIAFFNEEISEDTVTKSPELILGTIELPRGRN
jgi:hypothetical protein